MRPSRPAGYAAVGSLIALSTSLAVLFYVDNRNDNDLVRASCHSNNDRNNVVVSAFFELGTAFPESPEKTDFLDWIIDCLPQRNCDTPFAVPDRPKKCDLVTAREPSG